MTAIKSAKLLVTSADINEHLDALHCYLLDYPNRHFNVLSKCATDRHNFFVSISYGCNDDLENFTAIYRVTVRLREYKANKRNGNYTFSLTFHHIKDQLDNLALALPEQVYLAAIEGTNILSIEASTQTLIERRFRNLAQVMQSPAGSLFLCSKSGSPYHFISTDDQIEHNYLYSAPSIGHCNSALSLNSNSSKRGIMTSIVGSTVVERKMCLAGLVKEHLDSLDKPSSLIYNRTNSLGHKDMVLVESTIGLVHIIASSNTDPNASIPLGDYANGNRDFWADKAFVAFGWNTKDGRTPLYFVPVSLVSERESVTKTEIIGLRDRELSILLVSA